MDDDELRMQAVFERVAAAAKQALARKQSGFLGLFRAKDDAAKARYTEKAIEIVCKAAFRRWRAESRGKSVPDRYSDEGTSHEIEDAVGALGGSVGDFLQAHAEATRLVHEAARALDL
jgi:hypothetical protein